MPALRAGGGFFFGSPAVSEVRPVTLRTGLAAGVPLNRRVNVNLDCSGSSGTAEIKDDGSGPVSAPQDKDESRVSAAHGQFCPIFVTAVSSPFSGPHPPEPERHLLHETLNRCRDPDVISPRFRGDVEAAGEFVTQNRQFCLIPPWIRTEAPVRLLRSANAPRACAADARCGGARCGD